MEYKIGELHCPDIPKWFDDLRPWSMLTSRDIADIFAFSNQNIVSNLVRIGLFPKPDSECNTKKKLWKKQTIIDEINRRKALISGTNPAIK